MGLLPSLRRGSDRWWLPCSLEVTEALGELLLNYPPNQAGASEIGPGQFGSGHPRPANSRTDQSFEVPSPASRCLTVATRRRLHRAILNDPPLMIFAALGCTGDVVRPMQLVDWLAEHIGARLASGDAFLGEPVISSALSQRWRRLRDHFRTLPMPRWLDEAGLWLEAAGPPVPPAWKQEWPKLETDDELALNVSNADTESEPPFHLLQQLARTRGQQYSLQTAFDHRLQRNKLAAIKQLAYGLSHEINNPLANISTRAQQLQRGEEDPARAAMLQRIVDQVYRAHEMIADLMFFANPPEPHVEPVRVSELLGEVVEAYRAEAERQSIRLELNLADEGDKLEADPRMLRESVGVLIRNSIEAIGHQGTIVVSLENHPDHLLIHVADSGPGVSPEARRHAFDPYFSGREAGRGLGLGLCRAYRIVRLHHGEISLSGGPAGCVATILLRKS
jgi:signal transduction histidine kinase